jgi:hypothetical protein
MLSINVKKTGLCHLFQRHNHVTENWKAIIHNAFLVFLLWGFYFNAADGDWDSGGMMTLYNTIRS